MYSFQMFPASDSKKKGAYIFIHAISLMTFPKRFPSTDSRVIPIYLQPLALQPHFRIWTCTTPVSTYPKVVLYHK